MTDIPNLEILEAKTLQILQDEKRPLVSLKNLLRILNTDNTFAALEEEALADFIRAHELFCLAEPEADAFMEPAVYLATRVPSDQEMKAHMAIELENMMNALEAAHKEAVETNDTSRSQQLAALLQRANQIREALKKAS